MTYTFKFSFGTNAVEQSFEFDSLPVAAQEFIINYGLKQYLSDGAAVGKEECETEELRNELKASRVNERADKLRQGTMSQRAASSRVVDPQAKIKRELAKELLKAYCKANDLTFWKGQELTDKIESFWAKNGEKPQIKAELAKRIKAAEKAESFGEIEL